jgi:hypothetical protein
LQRFSGVWLSGFGYCFERLGKGTICSLVSASCFAPRRGRVLGGRLPFFVRKEKRPAGGRAKWGSYVPIIARTREAKKRGEPKPARA